MGDLDEARGFWIHCVPVLTMAVIWEVNQLIEPALSGFFSLHPLLLPPPLQTLLFK